MSHQIAAPTINGKPWYKSKTLWFNLICTALFAAEVNFKVLEGLIPGAVYSALAFVLPVGNMILRFITTTALIVPKVEQPAPPLQAGFISLAWLPALKWLGVAAVVAYAVISVYGAGAKANEAKWLKKEAAQAKVDQAERDRLAKLGQIAATFEIQSQEREAARNRQLQGVFHAARLQFPLVNYRAADGVHGGGHPARCGSAGSQRLAQGEATLQGAPEPLGSADLGEPGIDHTLTLGAVWLWNAALTGEASGAAGACRIDAATGQASAACAEPSSIDLDAAFANHTANAQSCAADRARHQRLIDYLQSL